MEKRRSDRIIVLLRAEIISRAEHYPGFLESPSEFEGVSFYTFAGIIKNVSQEGMMMTVPERADLRLGTGAVVEVVFQIPSDERVRLQCEIKWSRTSDSRDGRSRQFGMKIKSPPPAYARFVDAGLDQAE